MLNHVRVLTGDAEPNAINIDFEIAAINSTRTVFPNTNIYGCLFHLSKNVYRKVQENGLTNDYINNQVFS